MKYSMWGQRDRTIGGRILNSMGLGVFVEGPSICLKCGGNYEPHVRYCCKQLTIPYDVVNKFFCKNCGYNSRSSAACVNCGKKTNFEKIVMKMVNDYMEK